MSHPERDFMELAMTEALKAKNISEVPVGAVIVRDRLIIGSGHNSVIRDRSVTAHAEINAINAASRNLKNYRLTGCDIYITLEPCHMCAKAIIDARIKNVFFATPEPKTGSIISIDNFFDHEHLNHKINYSFGLMQSESSKLLKDFFFDRR